MQFSSTSQRDADPLPEAAEYCPGNFKIIWINSRLVNLSIVTLGWFISISWLFGNQSLKKLNPALDSSTSNLAFNRLLNQMGFNKMFTVLIG